MRGESAVKRHQESTLCVFVFLDEHQFARLPTKPSLFGLRSLQSKCLDYQGAERETAHLSTNSRATPKGACLASSAYHVLLGRSSPTLRWESRVCGKHFRGRRALVPDRCQVRMPHMGRKTARLRSIVPVFRDHHNE